MVLMTVAYDMRFITRMEQRGYHNWMVRVGLSTKHCRQKQFIDHEFGSIKKSLKAAKIYRDKEVHRLRTKHYVRFDLHFNPKKESVWHFCDHRKSGTYCMWIASVWDYKNRKQIKKTYSINKYGAIEAKRLAYKWRNKKRKELLKCQQN